MSERDDASYIQHLEAQIKKLEQEVARLRKEKGLSAAGDGLSFNKRTGTYIEASSGLHHCPKCLAKDRRHPMTDEEWGWRCNVCDAFYSNPDKEPPTISFQPGSDRY